MKIIDAGHCYSLTELDSEQNSEQLLTFVKRSGIGYPGNVGSHPGVTVQEVLRACIKRLIYVNNQITCGESSACIWLLRQALFILEIRAKRVKGKTLELFHFDSIEDFAPCYTCGHIYCEEAHLHFKLK